MFLHLCAKTGPWNQQKQRNRKWPEMIKWDKMMEMTEWKSRNLNGEKWNIKTNQNKLKF